MNPEHNRINPGFLHKKCRVTAATVTFPVTAVSLQEEQAELEESTHN